MEHNNSKLTRSIIGQNVKKTKINKMDPRINQIISKKTEANNLAILIDSKKKQKQIKQCFIDLIKTKEKDEKKEHKSSNIKKNEEKLKFSTNTTNKETEFKQNKYEKNNRNIKVNKIKIEKIALDNINNINSVTNRDFYQKSCDIS